ncbi:MAG: pantetheine-phosphate adenylyltransferase [Candidatus Adiutrix sp.]|jgi:pantetheine-phosphate adenylyltransferase|nr:pantetheine-phosphate adenylyltransferase [Candidatus Adiutrix sp.]
MMIGIYAGSFDPLTNGHLEIIQQAAHIFDRVIVLVAANPGKPPWLSLTERRRIIEESLEGRAGVDILTGPGTSVEYAHQRGGCLIRGLGEFTDYPAEKTLWGVNCRLRPEVATVFLMTRGAENQMRSSTVREAAQYQFGWRSIRDTVPRATFNAVALKLLAARPGLKPILESADISGYLKRPYHNLEHLIYMLELAALWEEDWGGVSPAELGAAIIYHGLREDVAASLEQLAKDDLPPGCSPAVVAGLIQATDHNNYAFNPGRAMTPAQAALARLDLAILGESPDEYARYARAIREEYAPQSGYLSETFQAGRRAFLTNLLARLAAGPLLKPEYDQRATVNARRELAELDES